ncbi:MAG: DUF1289 domain-containing protein, partial [Hyphomicrobiaceae bacterium]
METPCNNICTIDPVTRQCCGCFRTIDEIAGWAALTDDERARIMSELDSRRLKAG